MISTFKQINNQIQTAADIANHALHGIWILTASVAGTVKPAPGVANPPSIKKTTDKIKSRNTDQHVPE